MNSEPSTSQPAHWSEDDSALYRLLAPVAVPDRAEQIATLLLLMPCQREEACSVVELGCGPGALAHAILSYFPNAHLVGLDGSPSMLSHAAAANRAHRGRIRFAPFELGDHGWLGRVDGADCVVSSLILHHLSGGEKRRLFGQLARRISPTGALLIADLVMPQRPEARQLFADTWDRSAATQSARSGDGSDGLRAFTESQWNFFRYPDPADRPSSLFEQLSWLSSAGFATVDCFWMRAGHAIYGGYRQPQAINGHATMESEQFAEALEIAQASLAATAL